MAEKNEKSKKQTTLLGLLTGKAQARDRLHMGQDNPRNKASQKIASMEPKKRMVEAKKKDKK